MEFELSKMSNISSKSTIQFFKFFPTNVSKKYNVHSKMAQFRDWSDFNTTILGGQKKNYFCFEPKTKKNGLLLTNFAGKKRWRLS